MSVAIINFEVSLDTEEQMRELNRREQLDDSAICDRAIGLAHYIMTKLCQNRRFFMEDMPLRLPRAVKDPQPTFNNLRLAIHEEDLLMWDEICAKYGIDRHSALVWGLKCLKLFEETIITHRIFARGNGKSTQVSIRWLE